MKDQHRKELNTWYDGNQALYWCIDCVELWPCEAIERKMEDV